MKITMKKGFMIGTFLVGMSLFTACSSTPATAESAPYIPSYFQIEDTSDQVISVTASEELFVVPDIAELVFEVTSQDTTAEATQQKNTETLNQVIEYLKSTGIAETSIQTSNYYMNPIYDWNKNQAITGYTMSTSITVSDVPLDQAGTLITGAVENGVNQVSSVSYLSSNYDDTYQEALQKAIASAKVKAEAIASAGGRTVGDMVHVEEHAPYTSARYTKLSNYAVAEETSAASGASMDMMAGQVGVEAQVTVEFSIQ